ncbi:hypothetical protein SM124_13130 [Bacillus sp. 31A1R]|uniref:Uncharacterized protein n=1 Tax=Robertmurraya mangrovi TaxID=3098077 RepID=A0ABU5IZY8_9BACI|nr:hypothetical protein [Bacillus sp. 31A1R]MDZ5472675.1 hypothetical protein [Bacillus sp. 31A1R]
MNHSIHNPKLNRTIIKDFSRNKLKLSKTAISLLFQLASFIDRDGRIHLDKEYVRQQMFCDRRSLESALVELCQTTYNNKALLSFENGYYVSSFHLFTKGEETYLKHLQCFNSLDFLNLTKNQVRLFLNIATLNIRNQYTKVAVENLYKNHLHDEKLGMHVYDDYKSMTEDLFHLIDKEMILVRLPDKFEPIDKNNPSYKKEFHAVCGYVNNKKNRTSKYLKNKHVIGLKVNPSLFEKDTVKNIASETEIRLLADRYHMYHEDMKPETFNYFTGKKKKLMELFGLTGLEIYRSSLKKYFKEKNENILYYDLLGKAENHFTDFYLLEEMKKVILAAIETELGNTKAISTTGYSFTKVHIPSLVEYFITNSSEEHKVLIDQDIQKIKHVDVIMSDVSSKEPWTSLQTSIDVVYSKHTQALKSSFNIECMKLGLNYSDELFAQLKPREVIGILAKEAVLTKQTQLDIESNKLKRIVRFFRKKQMPFIMSPHTNTITMPATAGAKPMGIYDDNSWLDY